MPRQLIVQALIRFGTETIQDYDVLSYVAY